MQLIFHFLPLRPVDFGPSSLSLWSLYYIGGFADKQAQGEVSINPQAALFASS